MSVCSWRKVDQSVFKPPKTQQTPHVLSEQLGVLQHGIAMTHGDASGHGANTTTTNNKNNKHNNNDNNHYNNDAIKLIIIMIIIIPLPRPALSRHGTGPQNVWVALLV